MAISKRTILLALMLVVASGALAHAEPQSGAGKKRLVPVVILSTVSSRINDTLTIRGMGFGRRAAQVWCENYPLTVVSWTDSEIVVYLPDALPDGSYLLTVLRGDGQKDRDVFDMTVQGQTTSVAGPNGEPGSPGPKGDTGDVGPRGETGALGPQGETGAKGETGAAGPQGPTGAAGPLGERGPAGAQGETGAGPPGPAGLHGPQGEIGPAGPQGDRGEIGAQGPRGEAGTIGAIGLQGERGSQGAQGQAGAQGVVGPQGPAGVQGPFGPIGPAGPQGAAGVSGYEISSTPLMTVSMNGNQTTTLNALCPVGKVAIGGGFDYSGNTAPLTPVASFPVSSDTWRVMIRLSQIGPATFQGRAFSVCAAAR